MGEAPEDDDAPTDYAPTELGAAIDETEAHKAWALALRPPRNARQVRRVAGQTPGKPQQKKETYSGPA